MRQVLCCHGAQQTWVNNLMANEHSIISQYLVNYSMFCGKDPSKGCTHIHFIHKVNLKLSDTNSTHFK